MAFSGNGTTLSFGGADQGELFSVTNSETAEAINVTNFQSSVHEYEAGIRDYDLTFEVNGVSTLSTGDTGAVVIAWNDGTTDNIGTFVVIGNERTTTVDDKIASSLSMKPAAD